MAFFCLLFWLAQANVINSGALCVTTHAMCSVWITATNKFTSHLCRLAMRSSRIPIPIPPRTHRAPSSSRKIRHQRDDAPAYAFVREILTLSRRNPTDAGEANICIQSAFRIQTGICTTTTSPTTNAYIVFAPFRTNRRTERKRVASGAVYVCVRWHYADVPQNTVAITLWRLAKSSTSSTVCVCACVYMNWEAIALKWIAFISKRVIKCLRRII